MKFTFVLLILLFTTAESRSRYPKVKNKQAARDVLPKLNPDLLPNLEDLLEQMNLSHRKNQLVKSGVTETRNLLRMKRMDFQMMVVV